MITLFAKNGMNKAYDQRQTLSPQNTEVER